MGLETENAKFFAVVVLILQVPFSDSDGELIDAKSNERGAWDGF